MPQKSFVLLVTAVALSAPLCAQTQAQGRGQTQGQAQARPPAPDPHKIDMFMCDWRESMPRSSHGGLIERDILTPGDPRAPARRCAVLTYTKNLSYATLVARGGIAPMKLQGEQEVFYVVSGKGTVTSGAQTWDLFDGMTFLAPPGVEFSMRNTGDSDLNMYLFSEPIPAAFKPGTKLLVKNENLLPITSTTGHWHHIVKTLFDASEGLAGFRDVLTVALDPMTMGGPHSHGFGSEELWIAIKGSTLASVGTQLRWQTPGMAYLPPPSEPETRESVTAGLSFPHSNMNPGTEQVKFLYFHALGAAAATPAATAR